MLRHARFRDTEIVFSEATTETLPETGGVSELHHQEHVPEEAAARWRDALANDCFQGKLVLVVGFDKAPRLSSDMESW